MPGAADRQDLGRVVAAVVCGSLLLSCLVSFGYLEALRATRGEFYALALFSASGMCLLGQATDLIGGLQAWDEAGLPTEGSGSGVLGP